MKISVEELNELLAAKDVQIAALQAVNSDLQQTIWALQQDLSLCAIQQQVELSERDLTIVLPENINETAN